MPIEPIDPSGARLPSGVQPYKLAHFFDYKPCIWSEGKGKGSLERFELPSSDQIVKSAYSYKTPSTLLKMNESSNSTLILLTFTTS
jgi:glucan biosynthesis protein